MPDLNPEQFFHGTSHEIKGGMIRPAEAVGKSAGTYSFGDPGDLSQGDHAFAIRNDEEYAWHAAQTFHPNGGRARVYQVDPAPDMKPGPWNKDHPDFLAHHDLDNPDDYDMSGDDSQLVAGMRKDIEAAKAEHQDEWASPTGFPVRKRIDVMPGRQATFPSENWNDYKVLKPGMPRFGLDANHPDDKQVAGGMHWSENERIAAKQEKEGRSQQAFHDWNNDAAPHSVLREMAGRPQKRIATLFD